MQGNEDRRIRPVLRRYLIGYTLSAFGTGLWMPLNAIFLREERGLSAGGVGVYYAIVALTAIVANLFAGALADRIGPFRPLAVAGLLQATGILVLVSVDTHSGAYVAAVVCGIGNGAFFAVQTATLTYIFGLSNLSTVFGRQYQISNFAIGAGAFVLGGLVQQLGYIGYVAGFSLNAVSYVVHAWNVAGPVRRLAVRRQVAAANVDTSAAGPSNHPFRPYLDRAFLPVILTQLCIVMFGYAQLEAVVPVVFRDAAGLPLWGITMLTVANCIGVVAFQPWATRHVKRVGSPRGLRGAFVVWLVAALPAVVAVLPGPPWLRLTAVVLFAVIFAVGETLVSPSMQPMAAALAPTAQLSSYTAAVSLTFSLGLVIGPPVSLSVFAALGVGWYWAVVVAGLVLGLVVVRAAGARRAVVPPAPVPADNRDVAV